MHAEPAHFTARLLLVVVSAIRATISWSSHLHNGAEKKALTYGGVRAACVFARVCRLLSRCVFPHSCSVPRVPGRSAAQLITITWRLVEPHIPTRTQTWIQSSCLRRVRELPCVHLSCTLTAFLTACSLFGTPCSAHRVISEHRVQQKIILQMHVWVTLLSVGPSLNSKVHAWSFFSYGDSLWSQLGVVKRKTGNSRVSSVPGKWLGVSFGALLIVSLSTLKLLV